ncbi:MAG: NAD(P)H-hydrate dehydratase [Actinomycetota bacterium]|nr:NAD(P)H-hydrate dehydratase [Actinomycetota bacterium]
MIKLHDTAAIRAAEQAHAGELASGVLMDRAAHGLAQSVINLLTQARGRVVGTRVVLLVGPGNNGGDALYAGAKLAARGLKVDAISAVPTPHVGGVAAFSAAGGRLLLWPASECDAVLQLADVILDGLLGIGVHGELREPIAGIARAVRGSAALVIAVDVPSGLDANTGLCAADTVIADQTITFGGMKLGLVVMPGKEFAGGVRVIDIGVADELTVIGNSLDSDSVAQWLPEPALGDYKYRRGVVGIVAGSRQYPGAAFLTTAAAATVDIGMVEYLDRSDELAPQVVAAYPPLVITAADPVGNARVNAWAIGPGFTGELGDSEALAAILRCPTPVVIDGGALTALANSEELRDVVRTRLHPTVLTPHDGEFVRLSSARLVEGRIAAAQDLARELRVIVVLKGSGTVIAGPDGQLYIDQVGTAALGTAGSGDVLAGIMGALFAGAAARSTARIADSTAAEIAAAACWLHGATGVHASRGGLPVTATDLIAALPAAVAAVRQPARMMQ